jgi:hypothetical protein
MWSKIHEMWGQFPCLTTAPKWAGLDPLERDRIDQTVVPGRARAETTPMLSLVCCLVDWLDLWVWDI